MQSDCCRLDIMFRFALERHTFTIQRVRERLHQRGSGRPPCGRHKLLAGSASPKRGLPCLITDQSRLQMLFATLPPPGCRLPLAARPSLLLGPRIAPWSSSNLQPGDKDRALWGGRCSRRRRAVVPPLAAVGGPEEQRQRTDREQRALDNRLILGTGERHGSRSPGCCTGSSRRSPS